MFNTCGILVQFWFVSAAENLMFFVFFVILLADFLVVVVLHLVGNFCEFVTL